MKVICRRNTPTKFLAKKRRDYGLSPECDYGLVIGSAYTVFGVWLNNDECDYGIGMRGYTYPADLFDIIDPRCSRHWELARPVINGVQYAVLAYEEIARNYGFYEALVDHDEGTTAVHAKWLERFENEFQREGLATANRLQDSWLQCPQCSDAWLAVMEDGVVKCPSCGTALNNPFAVVSARRLERSTSTDR
jgi:ribosomal protein L37AE/L43A